MLQSILGVPVQQHDDGSEARMHDLSILYADRAPGAVEVTAAGDPEMIEFWSLAEAVRWREPRLAGGWAVHVLPTARRKRLRTELPELLLSFEQAGIRRFRPGLGGPSEELARGLEVTDAFQGGTEFPGSIYVYPELPPHRASGFVPTNGDALAEWLSEFLRSPAREDVRRKLALSGAAETHAFVIVPGLVADAPFAVLDLVMGDDSPLPEIDPVCPDEITDVWVATGAPAGTCFRWSQSLGWLRFKKPQQAEEPPGR
jgi:hypothetical protein